MDSGRRSRPRGGPGAVWACGVLIGLTLPAGCTAPGPTDPMQERIIPGAGPDEVLAAAAGVLQREFNRVRVDRSARRIEAGPTEFTTQKESGTARDLYGGRSTMRRKASLNIGPAAGGTMVRLRVDVERRDTERQIFLAPQATRLSDRPSDEPSFATEAATTDEQRAVWTRVRRDRALERALLEELREQFAPHPVSSESAPGAAEEGAAGTRPAGGPAQP